MNRVNVQIKNISKIKDSFLKSANFYQTPKIQIAVRNIMRTLVPGMILETLRETDTYKGLAGQFKGDTTGKDLQAEFGLTPELAEDVLSKVERHLAASIRVDRSAVSSNLLRIYASPDLETRLTIDTRGSSYISKNDYDIPWMEWVLNGQNTQEVHADIRYADFSDPKWESNSERAIMINQGVGYWSYLSEDQPNFIQATIQSPVFAKIVQNQYARVLKQVLRG